jgi:hypothetical protein
MKKAGQGTFALAGLLCSGKGGYGCGYEINIREIFSSRTFGNLAENTSGAVFLVDSLCR